MDERPAPADIDLTDSEQRLLDHIRAGLVDAEIAVRLGLSNAEVKARTERLAAKLRVDGRDALRTPPSVPKATAEPASAGSGSRPCRPALLPLAVTAGLALAFVAGLLVASRGEDEPVGASADRPSPVATLDEVPRPTQRARTEIIGGREMAFAGNLFRVPLLGAPVASSSARESLLVVTLAGDGHLIYDSGEVEWRQVATRYFLQGEVAGTSFELLYQPGNDATRVLFGPSASAAVYSVVREEPPVLVMYAMGPGRGRHHLEVTPEGELFIEIAPIPVTTVLDNWTGERLDLAETFSLGRLPRELAGYAFTSCEGPACWVSYGSSNAPLSALVAGAVSCPEDLSPDNPFGSYFGEYDSQMLVLTFDNVRIHYLRPLRGFNDVPAGDRNCPNAATVDRGDPLLLGGTYLLFASRTDGTPLDLAVAEDGTLYFGSISQRFTCPCLSGN